MQIIDTCPLISVHIINAWMCGVDSEQFDPSCTSLSTRPPCCHGLHLFLCSLPRIFTLLPLPTVSIYCGVSGITHSLCSSLNQCHNNILIVSHTMLPLVLEFYNTGTHINKFYTSNLHDLHDGTPKEVSREQGEWANIERE